LKKILVLIVLVFVISTGSITPYSFSQSAFDSKGAGLGMPIITMSPISGTPGTNVEISIENMPDLPNDLDPRVEFFVFLPFFLPLDSNNVPQTCNGEKCFPLYTFSELQQGKLSPKKIVFTLFGKQNPKTILEGGFVQSVCDLKINGKVVERFGYACNEKDQPIGEYIIKFGWGIQQSGIYDIRETKIFNVVEGSTSKKSDIGSSYDKLVQEFKDGLITIAQFQNGLKNLDYSDPDVRQTKAIFNMLDNKFSTLSPVDKKKITAACDKLRETSRIYAITDKEKYAPDDVIYLHGCVYPVVPQQTILAQISISNEKFLENKLIPEVDGSFYTSFLVDDKIGKDGNFTSEIIYGDQKKIMPFFVSGFTSLTDLPVKSLPKTQPVQIPGWIKNNAKWWADGLISEDSFVKGLEYLIKEKIIDISQTPIEKGKKSTEVPVWIKNNAKWWSSNQIDDKTFLSGIEYLVKTGIISTSDEIAESILENNNSNESDWQTSGPFQINKSKYSIGEKVFLVANSLNPNEKGEIAFMRPSNSTDSMVYVTVPFDGSTKSVFNYYIDPELSKEKGICSINDIIGKWELIFRGTHYPNISFEITKNILPGTNVDSIC